MNERTAVRDNLPDSLVRWCVWYAVLIGGETAYLSYTTSNELRNLAAS